MLRSAAIFVLLVECAARAAYFIPIGCLEGSRPESAAFDISADGTTVVGWFRQTASPPSMGTVQQPFRWTIATGCVAMEDRQPDGNAGSVAYGTSADGEVTVGGASNRDELNTRPVEWDALGNLTVLSVPDESCKDAYAIAVSDDASTVVGYVDDNNSCGPSYAIAWGRERGLTLLGSPEEGAIVQPEGVSGDGSIITGRWRNPSDGSQHAFRWDAENGYADLGSLGDGAGARAISADGNVIAGTSTGLSVNSQVFRWTEATGMVGLGFSAGPSGMIDLSEDGSTIVGQFVNESDEKTASIWEASTGVRELADVLLSEHGIDVAPWSLIAAAAVSNDGKTIVGWADAPNGLRQAWIANLETEFGKCCLPDGTCIDQSDTFCRSADGLFEEGTSCAASTCPTAGSCCQADGSCQDVSEFACPTNDWLEGDACDSMRCPQPGACCLTDGACNESLLVSCPSPVWIESAACSECPPLGACCQPDTSCDEVLQPLCSGIAFGAGVACDPIPCSEAPIAGGAGCRYLRVDVEPTLPGPVAIRVRNSDPKCADRFVAIDNGVGRLVDDPVFREAIDWGAVLITDAEVTPGTDFEIAFVNQVGESVSTIATTFRWGDVVNVDYSVPPDGTIDIRDILAAVDCFLGSAAVPGSYCDVLPAVPDGDTDITDILGVVDAFLGQAYPYVDAACP